MTRAQLREMILTSVQNATAPYDQADDQRELAPVEMIGMLAGSVRALKDPAAAVVGDIIGGVVNIVQEHIGELVASQEVSGQDAADLMGILNRFR